MKRKYSSFTIERVAVITATPVLLQSGAPGARMKLQAEVDPWIDANGGDPWDTPLNGGTPFEF